MKKVLFLLCLLLSFKSALAQFRIPTPDIRSTTKSNVAIFITNDGRYGYDLNRNAWGTNWPRGSRNHYIFGGGIWFGAIKSVDNQNKKLTVISYNPNSGNSWMAPGRVEDGKLFDSSQNDKYKLQFSTDYDSDGTSKSTNAKQWSLWNKSNHSYTNRFGSYEYNVENRSSVVYPKNATFISDEDIFCTFKDTDPHLFDYAGHETTGKGLPLGIQYEQSLYSWESSLLKDVIIIRYKMINTSDEVLKDCWVGPAVDVDFGQIRETDWNVTKDRVRFFKERPELHTAIAWSDGSSLDPLGMLAVSILESPTVDSNRNIHKNGKYYNQNEQIGLKTFRNWTYEIDPASFQSQYDFMSAAVKDTNDIAGDKRMLLTTGPFHMLPGDTTYLTVAFTFAKRDTANENYSELIAKIEAVRDTLFKNAGEEIPEANPENPFVIYNSPSEATLYLSLLKTENVKIEIFNVLGQRMSEVFKGELSAQNHAIPFSTSLFPSGAYYCAIVTDSGVEMVPVRIAR